jgi:hypothetical protein
MMETAQLFTQVWRLEIFPTPWALTACSLFCTLRVVAPNGRQSNAVMGLALTSHPVSLLSSLPSPADYPAFKYDHNQYFIVKASDGTHTELPNGTDRLEFSPDGTRYAFHTTVSGNTTIREERLPPTASPAVIAQSSQGFRGSGYVSNARYVAYENPGPMRRIFDYRTSAAMANVDSDVDTTMSPVLAPPLFLWPKLSAMKWQAFIGDKGTLSLEEPITRSPYSYGVRGVSGTEAPADYAGVSFTPTSTWVLDEKQGEVRHLAGGSCLNGDTSGMTDFCTFHRPGATDLVTFGPEIVLGQSPPAAASISPFVANGERGALMLHANGQSVWCGVVRP